MSDVTLQPIERPFSATISPPGSKSLTNRALVLAALANGSSRLSNVLWADDTRVMIEGLRQLGFRLVGDESRRAVQIEGRGGKIPAAFGDIFCGNSGTTLRFLTALCALGQGRYVLDGVPRMRQRPVGELVNLLHDMGVRSEYLGNDGYPPLAVLGDGLPGGMIKFGAALSSQFLSAILMISPRAQHEVSVDLIGRQTSWPYVSMTMRLMDEFGLTPEMIRDPSTHEPRQIVIPMGGYQPTDYVIEPDASNATYFLAAAAIHPGSKVTIQGLGKRSLQGDVGFADVLRRMGAGLVLGADFITVMGRDDLEGIDVDLAEMPDTAQTLAAIAPLAQGRTTIRGLHTLRVKETDRLAALSNELTRIGADVEIEDDTLHIDPPEDIRPAMIQTYDDHRMAMSFALLGTKARGITIAGAECVNKTYPNFFEDLRRMISASQTPV